MGLSGLILRKNNDMNFEKLVEDMAYIFKKLDLDYIVSNDGYHMSVQDKNESESSFFMYLAKKPDYSEHIFDWIDIELTTIVDIENISGCENMILKILHEYYKIYPNDYFYSELEWYYKRKDIEKIYESGDWVSWCYKQPD